MRQALFLALLLVLASCSKKPDEPVYAPSGGSWTFDGTEVTASFSDITARKGFQLGFSDKAATTSVRFLFRARPVSDAEFVAAPDTTRSADLAVHLESAGRGYHAVRGSNSAVSVRVEAGKIRLSGTGIRMEPDSGSETDKVLRFDLKEF